MWLLTTTDNCDFVKLNTILFQCSQENKLEKCFVFMHSNKFLISVPLMSTKTRFLAAIKEKNGISIRYHGHTMDGKSVVVSTYILKRVKMSIPFYYMYLLVFWKVAGQMANSKDPDQTLRRLIWVYTVCSGLSVLIRRVFHSIGFCLPEDYMFQACEKRFEWVHSVYAWTRDKGLNIRSCNFYPLIESRLSKIRIL